MGKKGIRDYLRDHSKAIRDIELTEAAILILDSVTAMQSVVGTLKRKQQVQLRRIDRAAALLGAPNKKSI